MIFKVSWGSLEITSYISEGFPSTRTSQEVFEICLLVLLWLLVSSVLVIYQKNQAKPGFFGCDPAGTRLWFSKVTESESFIDI